MLLNCLAEGEDSATEGTGMVVALGGNSGASGPCSLPKILPLLA